MMQQAVLDRGRPQRPRYASLHKALRVLNRVAAGLAGGYAFTWGFVAFGISAQSALGVDFHEAEMSMFLLAFLVYLGLFLWALSAASMLRVWSLLAGGAVLMTAAAWALQRALLQG